MLNELKIELHLNKEHDLSCQHSIMKNGARVRRRWVVVVCVWWGGGGGELSH